MAQELVSRLRARQLAAVVAILFGIVSVAAGWSVLAGRDPGYQVYRPLVVFNTAMGLAYIATGVSAWRRASGDRVAAAVIVLANALMLAYIVVMMRAGTAAVDSIRAMIFRTAVWLVLLGMLVWSRRAPRAA